MRAALAVFLTGCTANALPELGAQAFAKLPLTRVLTLDAEAGTVRCVAQDDPDEVHRPPPTGSDPVTFLLGGLRAETDYRCESDTGAVLDFTTNALPADSDLVLTYDAPASGYTAFNHWTVDGGRSVVQNAVVVDPIGRIVAWQDLEAPSAPAIDISLAPNGKLFVGGGPDIHPRWLDAVGRTAQILPEPPVPGPFHHHAQPLPNDEVVALSFSDNTDGNEVWQGFAIQWMGADGSPVWTWESQDHLDELPFRFAGQNDPWHPNSVTLREDALGPSAWIGLAWANEIDRIDRDTGAITHRLGAGGDFALVDADGNPLGDNGWFQTAHDPEWSGDRVLIHANGNASIGSSVIEYAIDLQTLTATRLWSWTEPGWWEPLFGDADRIGDHVLIARGRCWESAGCNGTGTDPDRHASILELDPATGEVPWWLELEATTGSLYRAERIDPCALWANQKWCPSL